LKRKIKQFSKNFHVFHLRLGRKKCGIFHGIIHPIDIFRWGTAALSPDLKRKSDKIITFLEYFFFQKYK
jgi:hypothetical protein